MFLSFFFLIKSCLWPPCNFCNILLISHCLESLMRCILHTTLKQTVGMVAGWVDALLPRTATHSHTTWQRNTLFSKLLSISKLCKQRATLALLLPCIWTIYKLKNTDFLFCSCGAPPNPPPNPPKCLCPPCNQPFNILPHIANKARTIKAVSKNIFTQMGKQKSTLKKKEKKKGFTSQKTNKQKENKRRKRSLRRDVTIRAKRMYLFKMGFLLSEDSTHLLTIL